MRRARTYRWTRMRPYRARFRGQGVFFAFQSRAGCITNIFGFDLRQAQLGDARLRDLKPKSFHQLGRFRHIINSDEVFGTHRASKNGQLHQSGLSRRTNRAAEPGEFANFLAVSYAGCSPSAGGGSATASTGSAET